MKTWTEIELKILFLQELNSLLEGCEKYIPADDDPSGCFGEYVLDTEQFRDRLESRLLDLQLKQGEPE